MDMIRHQDRDVVLELQPIIDAFYRDGRYYAIDYTRPLNPAFTIEESKWAELLTKPSPPASDAITSKNPAQ